MSGQPSIAVEAPPVTVPTDVEATVRQVAAKTRPRYARHVGVDDLISELWLYASTDGYVTRAAARGDDQRVYLALSGAARNYCETEKAHQSGYSLDDVAWYTPQALASLVPLALDPVFDGTSTEDDDGQPRGKTDGSDAANLLVQVLDVRAAISAVGSSIGTLGDDEYLEWLGRLAEWLGGSYPHAPGFRRGRREAQSNARAIATTRQEAGE